MTNTDEDRLVVPRVLAVTRGQVPRDWTQPYALSYLPSFEIDAIGAQIREKHLDTSSLLALCHHVRRHFAGTLLVNSRADVALEAAADGVHLPSSSIGLVSRLRRRVTRPFLIGCSVHSAAEARLAAGHGADYVVVGPVFETPSKKGMGVPLGLDGLEAVIQSLSIPAIAIGGIDTQRARLVLGRGAYGVSGIRGFQSAADLSALVRASIPRKTRERSRSQQADKFASS